MNGMRAFVFCAVSVLMGSFSGASEPEYIQVTQLTSGPRVEITLSGGVAQQTGYLTSENSVGTYVLGVNMESGSGLMSFEWNGFRAHHDTGEFALANDKEVRVSTFSFLPQIKVLDRGPWNIFLGFGLAHVTLSQRDPDYYTVYGSFILSGTLRYRLSERWSVHYKTQWYDVQQIVNDQDTSFEVWNHVAGLGWGFN